MAKFEAGKKVRYINTDLEFETISGKVSDFLTYGEVYTILSVQQLAGEQVLFLDEEPGEPFPVQLFELFVGYKVTVRGCDADNTIYMKLKDDELDFLNRFFEVLNKNSSYSCMPTGEVEKFD